MKAEKVQPQVVYVERAHNKGLAAVMSFFIPGLGQLYQGRLGNGAALFVMFVLSMPTIIGPIILWCVGIVDALLYKPKPLVVSQTQ